MDESSKSSSSSQNLNPDVTRTDKRNSPCLRHAVDNLANKSVDLSSNALLCKNCSKTMLSFIFLVQEVLDNLAKSIYCGEDSMCCMQCLRQELNVDTTKNDQSADDNKIETTVNINEALQKEFSEVHKNTDVSEVEVKQVSEDKASKPIKKPSSRRNSRRLSREFRGTEKEPLQNVINYGNQDWKINFLYNISPSTLSDYLSNEELSDYNKHKNKPIILNQECSSKEQQQNELMEGCVHHSEQIENDISFQNFNSLVNSAALETSFKDETTLLGKTELPFEISSLTFTEEHKQDTIFAFENLVEKENFATDKEATPFLKCNGLTEKNMVQPNTKGNLCKNANEAQEQNVSIGFEKIHSSARNQSHVEAFVTMCRNNSEALGCLVIGSSLLLSRTSKVLCVLVFDGVDQKLKELLSSVFNVVQHVSSLQTSKSVENEWHQRNLGNSFEKLNIWRLVQFNKCVFLNPDTLVLRNCDELFNCNELSAVPDNGWPDSFNSGVFVFVPSISTFSQMEEMMRKQGQNDGEEQFFLNSFFASWSRDLTKKLSFIYNLNLIGATYTYAAAFQKFGQNVKIVQFSGCFKPWNVGFHNETNQIVDASTIPSTSIRFIYEWISIFRVSVLRLFPQNVYSDVFAQKIILAEEVLSLMCSPEKYEDFNHRIFFDRTQQRGVKMSDIGENMNRKSHQKFSNSEEKFTENRLFLSGNKFQQLQQESTIVDQTEHNHESTVKFRASDKSPNYSSSLESVDSCLQNSPFNQYLPVSDSGNYEGMKAWEQGRMDYEGMDNSENIIKRLQLLIQ